MIISGQHVQLRSIEKNDIEQVRQWRNSPEIIRYMEHREKISPEMQSSWFEKVMQSGDHYLIITYKTEKVGMIHLRFLDAGRAESGLFIGPESYRNSPIGYWASLPLLDLGFTFLELNEIIAKVHVDNELARSYNQSLGFKLTSNLNEHFQEFSINYGRFQKVVEENKAFQALKGTYALSVENDKHLYQSNGLFISRTQ